MSHRRVAHCPLYNYSLTYLVLYRTIAILHMYVLLLCKVVGAVHYEKALVSSIIHLSLYIHLLFCTYYYLVYHQPHRLLPKALPRVILVMEFLDVWYMQPTMGWRVFFILEPSIFSRKGLLPLTEG